LFSRFAIWKGGLQKEKRVCLKFEIPEERMPARGGKSGDFNNGIEPHTFV